MSFLCFVFSYYPSIISWLISRNVMKDLKKREYAEARLHSDKVARRGWKAGKAAGRGTWCGLQHWTLRQVICSVLLTRSVTNRLFQFSEVNYAFSSFQWTWKCELPWAHNPSLARSKITQGMAGVLDLQVLPSWSSGRTEDTIRQQ